MRWILPLSIALLGALGCGGAGEDDEAGGAAAQTAVPTKRHLFVVQSKAFLGRITDETLGDFGGGTGQWAALYAFSTATNFNFSEDPQDGSRLSGQFRVWSEVLLDVSCKGREASLAIVESATDGGMDGPIHKAEFDPLKTLFDRTGAFHIQASGRPHASTEFAFQKIKERVSSTVWYALTGNVTCDDAAEARLALDDVKTSGFPSLRVWVTQHSGFGREGLPVKILDRPQGDFTTLWSLPPVPPLPTLKPRR